jgi:hypothetical protein
MKTKAGKTKGCGAGMYKCGGKHGKYEDGGKKKSKTVTVSPSGNYKTVVKSTSKDGVTKNKVTNRRTLKGVLSGAPSQKKLKNMTAPTSKGSSKINMPNAPMLRPPIPSNLKDTTSPNINYRGIFSKKPKNNTKRSSKINMPNAPMLKPLLPPAFPSFMSPDSVNKKPKGSKKSKLGPVATELNKLAKGGKMKTKKYAMGGMSQQCDPRDGSCKTVRKEGFLKRWIRNAKNRSLSNFSKPKLKRTRYK